MDELIDPNWRESAEPYQQFYWSLQEGNVEEIRGRLQPGGIYHDLLNTPLNRLGCPLALACHYDHPEVVRLLIANGADVHFRGTNQRTPIFDAIGSNSVACLRVLIQAGGRPVVEVADERGVTPVICAILNGHRAALRYLLHHPLYRPSWVQTARGNWSPVKTAMVNRRFMMAGMLLSRRLQFAIMRS